MSLSKSPPKTRIHLSIRGFCIGAGLFCFEILWLFAILFYLPSNSNKAYEGIHLSEDFVYKKREIIIFISNGH